MKHIASVSFGKDSLAMLLRLMDEGKPIDDVVFYDTGMEFDAIYRMRDKAIQSIVSYGATYTELSPQRPMEWDMFERPVHGPNGKHHGYSWCGGRCRWGTAMKTRELDRYCGDNAVYIGIAHDEPDRIAKERAANKALPLVDWNMTEGECLLYCYQRGYTWPENGKPLYALLDRASCWCCANKNLKELKNYYTYLPDYWERLKALQMKTDRPIKGKGKSVFELEDRFSAADGGHSSDG